MVYWKWRKKSRKNIQKAADHNMGVKKNIDQNYSKKGKTELYGVMIKFVELNFITLFPEKVLYKIKVLTNSIVQYVKLGQNKNIKFNQNNWARRTSNFYFHRKWLDGLVKRNEHIRGYIFNKS